MSRVASRALEKIIGENNNIRSKGDNQISFTSSKELPPLMLFSIEVTRLRLLQKKSGILPPSKYVYDDEIKNMFAVIEISFLCKLKSKVVYKLKYSGCKSTHAGQTVRHPNTRAEDRKVVTPVG